MRCAGHRAAVATCHNYGNEFLMSHTATDTDITDQHGAALSQPKNSPQRRGGGPDSWERTLPACNSNPMATTCTPEACAPRKTREEFLSKRQRIFTLCSTWYSL